LIRLVSLFRFGTARMTATSAPNMRYS
jgi:hypothetical protein